jgi:hypothetical protein
MLYVYIIRGVRTDMDRDVPWPILVRETCCPERLSRPFRSPVLRFGILFRIKTQNGSSQVVTLNVIILYLKHLRGDDMLLVGIPRSYVLTKCSVWGFWLPLKIECSNSVIMPKRPVSLSDDHGPPQMFSTACTCHSSSFIPERLSITQSQVRNYYFRCNL